MLFIFIFAFRSVLVEKKSKFRITILEPAKQFESGEANEKKNRVRDGQRVRCVAAVLTVAGTVFDEDIVGTWRIC